MDEFVLAMDSSECDLNGKNIDSLRILAMDFIHDSISVFYNQQAFSAAATSSSPSSLTEPEDMTRVPEPDLRYRSTLSLSVCVKSNKIAFFSLARLLLL